jgi:hypothetical protein
MDHLVTAESRGTRLKLTFTQPIAGPAVGTGQARRQIQDDLRTTVTRYKEVIEKNGEG